MLSCLKWNLDALYQRLRGDIGAIELQICSVNINPVYRLSRHDYHWKMTYLKGLRYYDSELIYTIFNPFNSIHQAILVIIAWRKKAGKKDIYILLPAGVSSSDSDEWWGAKRQCCGPWWYGDCVWLGFAIAVVLFCLSKGQRRQLNCPTRQPPHKEGLHAGDWLWGVRGLVGYLKRSQWT